MMRALAVEDKTTGGWVGKDTIKAVRFMRDGTQVANLIDTSYVDVSFKPTPGWHAYDILFRNDGAGDGAFNFYRLDYPGKTTGLLYAEDLWHGVCFNALEVAATGTFEVAAGQAVGLAQADAIDMKGTLVGAADSCLSVLGGQTATDLSSLASFAGIIELGEQTQVSFGAGPLACTLIGGGTVTASDGVAAALDASFFGIIDIPEGTVFTLPAGLSEKLTFSGAGTHRSATDVAPSRLLRFCGDASAAGGSLSWTESAVAGRWLENGQTLRLTSSAFAPSSVTPFVSWTDDFAQWTPNGLTYVNDAKSDTAGTHLLNKTLPYVNEAGELILSDDAAQHHAVVYGGHPLRICDDWTARFTLSMELPEDSWYAKASDFTQTYAEGMSVGLQGAGRTCSPSRNTYGLPSNLHGFRFYSYGTAAERGIQGVTAGEVDARAEWKQNRLGGIELHEPMQVTLGCTNGILTVTIDQDGKTFSCQQDVRGAFRERGYAYLTLGAATGWWWSKGVPWMLTRVSDFSGECRLARQNVAYGEADAAFAVSAENWKVAQNATVTNSTLHLVSSKVNTFGGALSTGTVPANRPCKVSFTATIGDTTRADLAEGFCVYFMPASLGYKWPSTSLRYYTSADTQATGFLVYPYSVSPRFSFFDQGQELTETSFTPFTLTKNATYQFTLEHDGAGVLKATVSNGSVTSSRSWCFENLPKADALRIGFWGANSTWGPIFQTDITDVNVQIGTTTADGAQSGRIAVAADASATLAVGPSASALVETAAPDAAFGGGNWVKAGNTTISGSTVKLMGSASNQKGEALCTKTYSAKDGFKASFDVTLGNPRSQGDAAEGFTFYLQPASAGTTISAGSGSARPVTTRTWAAFTVYYYGNGYFALTDNSESAIAAEWQVTPYKVINTKTYHIEVSYDGEGRLTFRAMGDGKAPVTATRTFPQIRDWGELRMGFSAAASSWGPYLETTLSNFALKTVAATAASAVGKPAGTVSEIALAGGSSLTVAPDGAASEVDIADIKVGGASTLAVGANASATVGGFTFVGEVPAGVTLTGSVTFADPLVIRLPADWASQSGLKLVDFSGATVEGALPTTIILVDEAGNEIKRGKVSSDSGAFRYYRNGLILLVK